MATILNDDELEKLEESEKNCDEEFLKNSVASRINWTKNENKIYPNSQNSELEANINNENRNNILLNSSVDTENTDNEINFYAIGDWGEATPALKKVGLCMSQTSLQRPADFIVALGDNFYENGVLSIVDSLWKTVFEDNFSIIECPWFPILGN
jgi:hypothetical protein